MNERLIVTLNVNELKQMIDECIKNAIGGFNNTSEDDILLKRVEVAKMFQVSLVTLNQWRREGLIIPYKIKSRVFYKRTEIIDAINNSVKKYARKNR